MEKENKPKINLNNINKILVVLIAGIGDLIMASPVFRALRAQFPKAYITALVSTRSAPILENCPHLDEIFTLDTDKLTGLEFLFNLPAVFKAKKKLKVLEKRKFDIAINLYHLSSRMGAFKTRILFQAISPKLSLGRDTNGRGGFYSLRVPDSWPDLKLDKRHEVEIQLGVVKPLGIDTDNPNLEMWLSKQEQEFASVFLTRCGINKNDLVIGFNPGAFRPSRRWNKESFAQVGDDLAKRYKAKILITGGPEEIELVQKIADMMTIEPIIATGEVTIKQLVSLIGRCNLFISNDTGAMHIATVMKTPLIALLGPGTSRYGPYGDRDRYIVVKKDVACSPCYKFKCRKHLCMKLITVEDVLKAAEELLKRFPR